jgi:hypothetical protein
MKKQIKACKDTLFTCLFNKDCISEEDKHWLDNKANLVDKDVVVDPLEKASDYKHGLEHLNLQQKLVEKLKELGGNIKKLVGVKRKCMCITTSLSMN